MMKCCKNVFLGCMFMLSNMKTKWKLNKQDILRITLFEVRQGFKNSNSISIFSSVSFIIVNVMQFQTIYFWKKLLITFEQCSFPLYNYWMTHITWSICHAEELFFGIQFGFIMLIIIIIIIIIKLLDGDWCYTREIFYFLENILKIRTSPTLLVYLKQVYLR